MNTSGFDGDHYAARFDLYHRSAYVSLELLVARENELCDKMATCDEGGDKFSDLQEDLFDLKPTQENIFRDCQETTNPGALRSAIPELYYQKWARRVSETFKHEVKESVDG